MDRIASLNILMQNDVIFRPHIINLPNNITEPNRLTLDDIRPINEKIRSILVGLTQKNYNFMSSVFKKLIMQESIFYDNSYEYKDKVKNTKCHIIDSEEEYNGFYKKISTEFILNMLNQELTESGSKNIVAFMKLLSSVASCHMKYDKEQTRLGITFIEEYRKIVFYCYELDDKKYDIIIPTISDICTSLVENLHMIDEETEEKVDKARRNIIKVKNLAHIACKLYMSGKEKNMLFLKPANFLFLIKKVCSKYEKLCSIYDELQKLDKVLIDKASEYKSILDENTIKLQNNPLETDEQIEEYQKLHTDIEYSKILGTQIENDYLKHTNNLDIYTRTMDIFSEIIYILYDETLEYMRKNDPNISSEITNNLKNKILPLIKNTRIKSLLTEELV